MKKAIIGNGGFGREVYHSIKSDNKSEDIQFFVDDIYHTGDDGTLPLSKFDPEIYQVIIAVGDPKSRKLIVERLPKNTVYFTHIHSSVIILDPDIKIGEGSIICANCILTTNIVLGKHTHLNLSTTIGHDCVIGDFFTTAPGAKISGNCNISDIVYFGTNSSIREKLNICSDVTIGLNAGVVKNITEPGTYVGVPAKKK